MYCCSVPKWSCCCCRLLLFLRRSRRWLLGRRSAIVTAALKPTPTSAPQLVRVCGVSAVRTTAGVWSPLVSVRVSKQLWQQASVLYSSRVLLSSSQVMGPCTALEIQIPILTPVPPPTRFHLLALLLVTIVLPTLAVCGTSGSPAPLHRMEMEVSLTVTLFVRFLSTNARRMGL